MENGAGIDHVWPADDIPPDAGPQEYCGACGDFIECCDGHEDEGPELKLTQEDAPREQGEMFKNLPQRASNEEHVSDGGERCPFCRSDEIEGGEVSTGGGSAWQGMSCRCGATWYDHYTLHGYTKR